MTLDFDPIAIGRRRSMRRRAYCSEARGCRLPRRDDIRPEEDHADLAVIDLGRRAPRSPPSPSASPVGHAGIRPGACGGLYRSPRHAGGYGPNWKMIFDPIETSWPGLPRAAEIFPPGSGGVPVLREVPRPLSEERRDRHRIYARGNSYTPTKERRRGKLRRRRPRRAVTPSQGRGGSRFWRAIDSNIFDRITPQDSLVVACPRGATTATTSPDNAFLVGGVTRSSFASPAPGPLPAPARGSV